MLAVNLIVLVVLFVVNRMMIARMVSIKPPTPEKQIAGFIAKFTPEMATRI